MLNNDWTYRKDLESWIYENETKINNLKALAEEVIINGNEYGEYEELLAAHILFNGLDKQDINENEDKFTDLFNLMMTFVVLKNLEEKNLCERVEVNGRTEFEFIG